MENSPPEENREVTEELLDIPEEVQMIRGILVPPGVSLHRFLLQNEPLPESEDSEDDQTHSMGSLTSLDWDRQSIDWEPRSPGGGEPSEEEIQSNPVSPSPSQASTVTFEGNVEDPMGSPSDEERFSSSESDSDEQEELEDHEYELTLESVREWNNSVRAMNAHSIRPLLRLHQKVERALARRSTRLLRTRQRKKDSNLQKHP